ncbi:MAG: NADAR family protein [Phycisphaerales bacterium]
MKHRRKSQAGIWFRSDSTENAILSNFAHTPFELDGHHWPTVEHYYQASKCITPAEAAMIRLAESPLLAKALGRKAKCRRDWDEVRPTIMLRALEAKFRQSEAARLALLDTGNEPLHEDAPRDPYWGGQGKDRLGKLLVRLRDEMRSKAGAT